MRWRRKAGRGTAEGVTGRAAPPFRHLPATRPERFAHDVHPAVRAEAARVQVANDERRGLETPQWIVDLSRTYPRF
jgi:hypothetical protein